MIGDLLVGGLRLLHALAATLWLGGSLVYILVPAGSPFPSVIRSTLPTGVIVFVVTGAVLAVQRLSSAPLPPAYVAVLAVKAVLGLWMFALARRVVRPGGPSERGGWRRPEGQMVLVGVTIYGLAVALRAIYEASLRN